MLLFVEENDRQQLWIAQGIFAEMALQKMELKYVTKLKL